MHGILGENTGVHGHYLPGDLSAGCDRSTTQGQILHHPIQEAHNN